MFLNIVLKRNSVLKRYSMSSVYINRDNGRSVVLQQDSDLIQFLVQSSSVGNQRFIVEFKVSGEGGETINIMMQ